MESIYGKHLPEMQLVMEEIRLHIEQLRKTISAKTGMDPVEHCLARIKSEESMREKCRRHGMPETSASALELLHDAIGFRIVCAFLNDIYMIRDYLSELPGITVIAEKDYIRHAKPNGYRSYHMIVRTERGYYVEFQIRTISMDTWAALEHHMKYKKQLGGNLELLTAELKRCAEELASTDVSMQTLRDMIFEEETST
jgi:putative GTP pyrophosphokinase